VSVRIVSRRLASLAVLALALPATAPQQLRAQSASDSVVAVVQEFFRSMEANDVEAAQRIMVPGGQSFATRRSGDSTIVRTATFQSHFERLRAARDTVLERIWSPTVQVHESIATLWAPYDLYVNGRFSHCGIDAFSLVRTSGRWLISGIIYTVEPTGCAPSPLGPPARR